MCLCGVWCYLSYLEARTRQDVFLTCTTALHGIVRTEVPEVPSQLSGAPSFVYIGTWQNSDPDRFFFPLDYLRCWPQFQSNQIKSMTLTLINRIESRVPEEEKDVVFFLLTTLILTRFDGVWYNVIWCIAGKNRWDKAKQQLTGILQIFLYCVPCAETPIKYYRDGKYCIDPLRCNVCTVHTTYEISYIVSNLKAKHQ